MDWSKHYRKMAAECTLYISGLNSTLCIGHRTWRWDKLPLLSLPSVTMKWFSLDESSTSRVISPLLMTSSDQSLDFAAVLYYNQACTPLQIRLLVCQSSRPWNLASCVPLQVAISYRVSSIDKYRVLFRVSSKKSVSTLFRRFLLLLFYRIELFCRQIFNTAR